MTLYMLAGGNGTAELNPDGSVTVRDLAGRAVVTVSRSALPPGALPDAPSGPRSAIPANMLEPME